MGHLEFEGFDAKTTKALKKKVADTVAAPITRAEAIKELASVFIDEDSGLSGLKDTANGLQFYAYSTDGSGYWCQGYHGSGRTVKFWEVCRDNGVMESHPTLDALLAAL